MTTSTSSGRKVPLDPEFHFFSDTELATSQLDARPNAALHVESVQSDTEFEVQKSKGKIYFVSLHFIQLVKFNTYKYLKL